MVSFDGVRDKGWQKVVFRDEASIGGSWETSSAPRGRSGSSASWDNPRLASGSSSVMRFARLPRDWVAGCPDFGLDRGLARR